MEKPFFSDMKKIREINDEDIDTQDPDALELDDSFFEKVVIEIPKPKIIVLNKP